MGMMVKRKRGYLCPVLGAVSMRVPLLGVVMLAGTSCFCCQDCPRYYGLAPQMSNVIRLQPAVKVSRPGFCPSWTPGQGHHSIYRDPLSHVRRPASWRPMEEGLKDKPSAVLQLRHVYERREAMKSEVLGPRDAFPKPGDVFQKEAKGLDLVWTVRARRHLPPSVLRHERPLSFFCQCHQESSPFEIKYA